MGSKTLRAPSLGAEEMFIIIYILVVNYHHCKKYGEVVISSKNIHDIYHFIAIRKYLKNVSDKDMFCLRLLKMSTW